MKDINVFCNEVSGKVKPLNAVNNGPTGSFIRQTGNSQLYYQAQISYARLHDSAFSNAYGGEWSVDVHRIFRNFDADENNPNSYIFEPTDKYLKSINDVGTKIFYRLGAAIEHGYKFGTYPPKDYLKWARICEHIIMHYTEGWANGFYYDIEYWEIWNEPDNKNWDGSNPCWQGSREDFIDFYCVTSTYLKKKFPHLKIGGPASGWVGTGLLQELVPAIKERGACLDFYSFHRYAYSIQPFIKDIQTVRDYLDEMGFVKTEVILNEWNYIKEWVGEEYINSQKKIKGLFGASFVLSAMCESQKAPVDMLMYYDARPCNFNGIFNNFGEPLKTYYVLKSFGEMYKMGNNLKIESSCENIYTIASKDNNKIALLLTYFDNNNVCDKKEVVVNFKDIEFNGELKIEKYLLDEYNDMQLIETSVVHDKDISLVLSVENLSSYFVKIIKE